MSRAERCTACDDLRRQLEETRRQVPQGAYTCEWRWEEEIRTLTQQRDEARAELATLRSALMSIGHRYHWQDSPAGEAARAALRGTRAASTAKQVGARMAPLPRDRSDGRLEPDGSTTRPRPNDADE